MKGKWWFVSYDLNEILIQRACHHSCCLLYVISSSLFLPHAFHCTLWSLTLTSSWEHTYTLSFHFQNQQLFYLKNKISEFLLSRKKSSATLGNFSGECLWTLHKGNKLRSLGVKSLEECRNEFSGLSLECWIWVQLSQVGCVNGS